MTQTFSSNTPPAHRYFAFISYNRKDKSWAQWLQKRLETYRLPTQIRKGYSDLPSRITPIFRDETDLSGIVLKDSLERELAASNYLIVICSPNSVASQYVNQEIAYFKSLGRSDHIIPFVVDGVPFSQDPSTESFPEQLRQITPELLGISVAELGRRNAFLRVVSTLLQLRYDEVVMRDKKRLLRNRCLTGLAVGAMSVALGAFAWYNTEHSKYYNSYICRNEIPEGLYELSDAEKDVTSDCYRITTLQGKVIRLENINSLGIACDPTFTTALTDYPILEYQYDDDGQLISILQKDANGMIVFRKDLSVNQSTNEIAIDFHSPTNELDAQALSSDMSFLVIGDQNQSTKSEITRQRNTYDENGFLIRSLYQRDNLGTPACDANGVYGKLYEYNTQGQVIRISNLDEHGNVHNCRYGWATEEFTYDEFGNETYSQFYDADGNKTAGKDGYSGTHSAFDDNGNLIQWQSLDKHGQVYNNGDGYSTSILTYNAQGFVESTSFFDASGNAVYQADGIHQRRFQYDSYGRLAGESYYDVNGQPLYSSALASASYKILRNEAGQITEVRQYDTKGDPICTPVNGTYGVRHLYNEDGYPCGWEYLDAQGEPTMSKYGYASIRITLDDANNPIRYEYLDEHGDLTRSTENCAVVQRTYDTFGNLIRIQVYDENLEPCYHVDGYSIQEYTYEDGNTTSQAFYDANGDPMLCREFYHMSCAEYDEKGNAIRYTYHDVDGTLMELPDSYAVVEQDYDTYGNVLEKRFYTADMQPAMLTDVYQYNWTYDERGNCIREERLTAFPGLYTAIEYEYDDYDNCIHTQYLDSQGNLVVNGDNGAFYQQYFDAKGNLLRLEAFDVAGLPLNGDDPSQINAKELTYDDYGNLTLERYLHQDADRIPHCLWQTAYTYDILGNCICTEYLDSNGDLVINNNGYARVLREYYQSGDVCFEEYYGENNQPVLYNDTAFRYEYEYNATGLVTEMRLLDANRQLLKEADQLPSILRYEYDARGLRTWRYLYNENDEAFHIGDTPVKGEQYFRDIMGYSNGSAYYDLNGNVLAEYCAYVYVNEIVDGFLAQEAGAQAGQFLIQVGDWNYFEEGSPSHLHDLTAEFSRAVYKEKVLVLCEWTEDDSFVFHRYELPEGVMGIHVLSENGSVSLFSEIKNAYQQWLQENP